MTPSANNVDTAPVYGKGFHPKRFLKDLQQKLYNWQYSYLLFSFIVPVVLMYLIYTIIWATFTGKGTPLVLDLNAQYVYFFEALREFVYGENSLLYSFGRSLGGEFMGIYAYYLASPLSYIVALFPQDRMQEAILTILLVKTGLCGATFGFYLHKRSPVPNKLSIFIFSLLYSLSAFAVVHQNNTMWIDALIWLPLFVYGLEELIDKRRFKLYVISLAAILISNYYIGYMVCIFAILYFCYYYFSKDPSVRNPKNKHFHFLTAGGSFAVFSLIAAAMSAFMLIAAYYSLGFGKTEFSDPSWAMRSNFDILDFIVKLLPGSFDTVEPAGLPFVYCGVLTLILLPVYFTAKRISVREKIASAALIAVFLVSFIVNPIDLIWHGFSQPNWLNARYSFLFCFFIIVLAYKAFGNLKETSDKFILCICGLLLLTAAVAEKFEFKSFINVDQKFSLGSITVEGRTLWTFGCIWFSVLFIIAIGTLLCAKMKTVSKRSIHSITSVLAAVVCAELLLNGVVCLLWFNRDVVYAKYDGYQGQLNELRPIISQVTQQDDGFYRMEKTYHRTKNENMALGLKGITNSTSTLNSSAIDFVNKMGYTGRAHLTMYRGGTPFSDSLLGIKYVIAEKDSPKYENSYAKVDIDENEKYDVFKNPYAMSLAFGVDPSVNEFDLEEYGTFFSRYNALAASMIGAESTMLFRPVKGMEISPMDCEKTTSSGLSTKITTTDTDGIVAFSYIAPYSGDYYFYSPVRNPSQLKAEFSANEGTYIEYLGGDSNHVLYAGHYEKDEEIHVFIHIPENKSITFKTDMDFLWYFDSQVYDDTMQTLLSGPQLDIDSSSTDDHITGNISTTESESTILTTIPFDKGWKVFVDGNQVDTYETLDALMVFDIEGAGNHTVEMKYFPDIYVIGICVSALGIFAFIALCVIELILNRRRAAQSADMCIDGFWDLPDFESVESENSTSTDIKTNDSYPGGQ